MTDILERLRGIRDDLSRIAAVPLADPYIIVELRALGERAGYGNVMSSASALWRSNLGELAGGEFACGPCRKTIENSIATLDEAAAHIAAKDAAIAELETQLRGATRMFSDTADTIATLRADLAKAVEGLEPFAEIANWADRNGHNLHDFDMLIRHIAGPKSGQFAGHLGVQAEQFIAAQNVLANDPPCTDCQDTGYNPNTEKACTCEAALGGEHGG